MNLQPGRQIQQVPASQTTSNHISGKPNVVAHAEMMQLQCTTTNFPTMTCSSGEPNSKTQQTDQQEATACNWPASCCQMSHEESRWQHRMTPRHQSKQGNCSHTCTPNLLGQTMETHTPEGILNQTNNWSIQMQTTSTASLLQSHAFRCPQKTV